MCIQFKVHLSLVIHEKQTKTKQKEPRKLAENRAYMTRGFERSKTVKIPPMDVSWYLAHV